jgi:LmbE family N-acetylglucosaminyl deacetylase
LVYHYIQWQSIEPDFVVDVSEFMDIKMKAVKAYATQFYNPNSNEPNTPITSKNFLDSIEYRAMDLGRLVGVAFAEGFTIERHLTVNSLGDLK